MIRTWLAGTALVLAVVFLPGLSAGDAKDEGPQEQMDPDLVAGKAAIAAKNWSAAIKLLSAAAQRNGRDADVQNYLGYAYRQSGQLEPAFKHYARALQLNPGHRGAHEYVGEAYLLVNNPAKAEEHLKALQRICQGPCEEYDDLKKALADYRGRAR